MSIVPVINIGPGDPDDAVPTDIYDGTNKYTVDPLTDNSILQVDQINSKIIPQSINNFVQNANNIGSGTQIFKQKNNAILEFKTLNNSGNINIIANTDDIDLAVNINDAGTSNNDLWSANQISNAISNAITTSQFSDEVIVETTFSTNSTTYQTILTYNITETSTYILLFNSYIETSRRRDAEFAIFRNGTEITSTHRNYEGNGGRRYAATSQVRIALTLGDTITVQCRIQDNGTTLQVFERSLLVIKK